jgi:hypothetical protein
MLKCIYNLLSYIFPRNNHFDKNEPMMDLNNVITEQEIIIDNNIPCISQTQKIHDHESTDIAHIDSVDNIEANVDVNELNDEAEKLLFEKTWIFRLFDNYAISKYDKNAWTTDSFIHLHTVKNIKNYWDAINTIFVTKSKKDIFNANKNIVNLLNNKQYKISLFSKNIYPIFEHKRNKDGYIMYFIYTASIDETQCNVNLATRYLVDLFVNLTMSMVGETYEKPVNGIELYSLDNKDGSSKITIRLWFGKKALTKSKYNTFFTNLDKNISNNDYIKKFNTTGMVPKDFNNVKSLHNLIKMNGFKVNIISI